MLRPTQIRLCLRSERVFSDARPIAKLQRNAHVIDVVRTGDRGHATGEWSPQWNFEWLSRNFWRWMQWAAILGRQS